VIAVDSNLLVFAHRRDSPWHQAARQRLTPLVEGDEPWAIPWPCLYEFFAIVSRFPALRTRNPLLDLQTEPSAD
jgi:predicted nucleic acid-binding protein